jgi:hypothetical protein
MLPNGYMCRILLNIINQVLTNTTRTWASSILIQQCVVPILLNVSTSIVKVLSGIEFNISTSRGCLLLS